LYLLSGTNLIQNPFKISCGLVNFYLDLFEGKLGLVLKQLEENVFQLIFLQFISFGSFQLGIDFNHMLLDLIKRLSIRNQISLKSLLTIRALANSLFGVQTALLNQSLLIMKKLNLILIQPKHLKLLIQIIKLPKTKHTIEQFNRIGIAKILTDFDGLSWLQVFLQLNLLQYFLVGNLAKV
jgi:hypothetical protein